MASPRKESLKCHACCDVNTKMPVILSLKRKETDELNLKKKSVVFLRRCFCHIITTHYNQEIKINRGNTVIS